MHMIKLSNHLLQSLCVFLLVLGLASCSSRIYSQGNLPDEDRLSDIEIGVHNREHVSNILGSPSSIAVFDKETWYYISKRTESFAFFEPELKERQVVILRFDSNGVVSDVSTLDMKDGRLIQPVERETPTAGNELGVIDQIIANFGRFRKKTQQKMEQ